MARHRLLAGTATAGAGNSIKVAGAQYHTVQITTGTGASGVLSNVIINLQGSLDNTTFFDIGSHTFTAAERAASGVMWHTTDKPINYVRLNVATLSGAVLSHVTFDADYTANGGWGVM